MSKRKPRKPRKPEGEECSSPPLLDSSASLASSASFPHEILAPMKVPLLVAATLVLAGCSQGPETAEKKPPEPPLEPATGQSALYKMYQVARSWATDAQILKMNSISMEGQKPEPGRAAAWEVMFVSPSKQRARS